MKSVGDGAVGTTSWKFESRLEVPGGALGGAPYTRGFGILSDRS